MNDETPRGQRGNRLALLSQTQPGTLMGKLLRTFWQPIAVSTKVAKGEARSVRILAEDLTLFRGETGHPYLVAGRCAHRCTVLHTGWVEGEDVRCVYHGWKYAGATGQCVEMPAERQMQPKSIKIAAYPLHEYGGLIFAYMGEAPAPPFELPRKDMLEREDYRFNIVEQVWDCNWFQQVENSLDAVHVSFVHTWGSPNRFTEAYTTAIPELSYAETEAGIRQTATRSKDNVRISDWTFPNNNHVLQPGPQKDDPWSHTFVWAVPIDDENTLRFIVYAHPPASEDTDRRIAADSEPFEPAEHYDEVFNQGKLPKMTMSQLIAMQDYVALRGQGVVVNRGLERLGQSDAGIALLRKTFFRELELIRLGRPTKRWSRIAAADATPLRPPEPALT